MAGVKRRGAPTASIESLMRRERAPVQARLEFVPQRWPDAPEPPKSGAVHVLNPRTAQPAPSVAPAQPAPAVATMQSVRDRWEGFDPMAELC